MASVPTYSVLIPNLVLFQGIWWSCILNFEPLAIVLLIVMALHFLWSHNIIEPTLQKTDWLILPIMVTGLLTDWLLYQMGLYGFLGSGFPLWLMILWFAFSMTVPRSLASVVVRKPLWLGLCIVFGPLAYFGGQYYGRLEIFEYAIFAMAIQWAFIGMFSHFMISTKIEGTLSSPQRSFEVENK